MPDSDFEPYYINGRPANKLAEKESSAPPTCSVPDFVDEAEGVLSLLESDFGQSGRDVRHEAIRVELQAAYLKGMKVQNADVLVGPRVDYTIVVHEKKDSGFFITSSVPGLFLWGPDLATLLSSVPRVVGVLRKYNGDERPAEKESSAPPTGSAAWQPIETAPENEVVLLCDKDGNRWTDVVPWHIANSCGLPPEWWMPLPEPHNDRSVPPAKPVGTSE